jgi:hypothetical protein
MTIATGGCYSGGGKALGNVFIFKFQQNILYFEKSRIVYGGTY